MTDVDTARLESKVENLEGVTRTLVKQIDRLVNAMSEVNVRLAEGALMFATKNDVEQLKDSLGMFIKVTDCKEFMKCKIDAQPVDAIRKTIYEIVKLGGWLVMAGFALWRLTHGA